MKRLSALLLLFALLAGALVLGRAREHGRLVFPSDVAYVDRLLATVLNAEKMYGLSAHQPVLAERDLLWHSMLALGARGGPVSSTVLLTGSLLSAFGLLLLVLLWRSGLPGADWRRIAALALLVAAPPILDAAVSGTATLLAAGLVLGAAMVHVRGFATPTGMLSPGAAALLGLAAWLRLECVLWWPVFALHAVIASFVVGTWRRLLPWLLARVLVGALLIAVVVAPLLAWNMRVAGIPWPLALDATAGLSASPGAAIRASLAGCVDGWAALHHASPISTDVVRAFFWIGLLSSFVRVVRRESAPSVLLPLFAYAMLPPLAALPAPWLGQGGATVLYLGAAAIWLPAIVEGFWFTARVLVNFLRKAGLREDAWLTPTRAAGVIATLVFFWSLVVAGRVLQRDAATLRDRERAQTAVLNALHDTWPRPTCVATDEPGWVRLRGGYEVVDLSGHLTLAVRAAVDDAGRPNAGRLQQLLRRRGAVYAVTRAGAALPRHHVAMEVPGAVGFYQVSRLRPPGAP